VTDPIVVSSSRGAYPVIVAAGALGELPKVLGSLGRSGRAFAVAGSGVLAFHENPIRQAVGSAELLAIEDGERAKTLASVERLLDALVAAGTRRDSVLLAIGGGTVGDAAGFAAAILFRGIDLVHVPTTFLAQIDSSIGGKVGVNHSRGKNLIGAFWPPRAVLVDPSFLATLPEAEFRSGWFEALKCGVIADERLFEVARTDFRGDDRALLEILRRSIAVKAAVVSEDEREGDRRRLLNYGHTIGHAIEAALGFASLTHGEAVGWGMIGANAIAARRGLLTQSERSRIDTAIRDRAPRRPVGAERDRVLSAVGMDKKFTSRGRVMVLPKRIGDCAIAGDVTDDEIAYGVAAALAG
jgi:3-dehydroquinate synthase